MPDFNMALGPRQQELLGPVMRCLEEATLPLNVEDVRFRLGAQKGAFLAIRTLLIHLEKSGTLTARMIEGSTHYSIRKEGKVPDLTGISRKLGVGLEWICRGSTHLLRVSLGDRTASFSLRPGQRPEHVSEEWIERIALRGKKELEARRDVPPRVEAPTGPRDSGVSGEDLLRAAVERRKNRFAALG